MSDLTTADVANRLACSPYKVRALAQQVGIGVNLGGRAGYRFTEAEYEQLRSSMRVLPTPKRRSRRRVA
jgi:hypothetical protein